MKRMIRYLAVILSILILGSGCGSNGVNDSGEKSPSFSCSMNFYPDEFEEEYSHYEKDLTVGGKDTEIVVAGNTVAGKIDLKVECSNGWKKAYTINNDFEKKIIPLSGYEKERWKVYVDCYADTEGNFSVSVR